MGSILEKILISYLFETGNRSCTMAEKDIKPEGAAILSAEPDRCNRHLDEDAEAGVAASATCRDVLGALVRRHDGSALDSPGDSLLARFGGAVDAVRCAVIFQKTLKTHNDELPANRRMQFRIGIHFSDVVQEEAWIHGDGAGIAAGLKELAEPGGIIISGTAFDHVEGKLPYGYERLKDQRANNLVKSAGAYRVLTEPIANRPAKSEKQRTAAPERMPFLLAASGVLVAAIGVIVWQFYIAFGPAVALTALGFGLCLLYVLYFTGS